ncbi:MAG: hypothetical protein BMS9Abin37_1679 [Acidobacteriota bacterium]|nr:MAG: hypothetical protein BMS9Abin37_1679 [Acidobacteriota bacterium]
MGVAVNVLIACGLMAALASGQVPQLHQIPQIQDERVELVLDGVIVAASPADSIALIRRAGGRRARALRVGQEYCGYVLVEVTRNSVFLKGPHAGLRIAIAGSTALTALASEPEPERTEPGLLWVRRSFSRAEANQRLEKEIPVILSDTEVTPRVVEGEVLGLELLRLPDGTVLSQSGLLPGDVLRSINEQPLRGLDSLWRLLARFADNDELRVVVDRRGEVVRFAYDFTN